MTACMVDENAPHQLGRNGEEVAFVFPLNMLLFDEPEVGFIYQCGGLKGVVGPLSKQIGSSQAAKFVIDERNEGFASLSVTPAPLRQQFRDLMGRLSRRWTPILDFGLLAGEF